MIIPHQHNSKKKQGRGRRKTDFSFQIGITQRLSGIKGILLDETNMYKLLQSDDVIASTAKSLHMSCFHIHVLFPLKMFILVAGWG